MGVSEQRRQRACRASKRPYRCGDDVIKNLALVVWHQQPKSRAEEQARDRKEQQRDVRERELDRPAKVLAGREVSALLDALVSAHDALASRLVLFVEACGACVKIAQRALARGQGSGRRESNVN